MTDDICCCVGYICCCSLSFFFLSFLSFIFLHIWPLFCASAYSIGDGPVCGCSIVLLGMSRFINCVSRRGTIDGCVSEGGVEEGIVAEGGVEEGSHFEVNGMFQMESVGIGFFTTSGD